MRKPTEIWSVEQARAYFKEKPAAGRSKSKPASKSKAKEHIVKVFLSHKISFETEYLFDSTGKRRFKFDYALPEKKLAIEYEGLFSSKSRHTTKTGYTRDTQKYNLAAAQGWTVFRYTAMNYTEVERDLLAFLKIS